MHNRLSGPSQSVFRSILRLLGLVFRTGRLQMLAHLVLQFACGLLPAATALLWQRILGAVVPGAAQHSALGLFIAIALVGGLSVSYAFFTEVTDTLLRNRMSRHLQRIIHHKAAALPLDNYESAALNDVLTRASEIFCYGDATGFIVVFIATAQQLVVIVSMGIVLWGFHPLLTLSALLMLIPCLAKLWLNKLKVELNTRMSPIRREADGLRQYMTKHDHVKEVRALQADAFFLNRWRGAMDRIVEQEQRLNARSTHVRIWMDVLERGVTIISYFLCVYLATRGQIGVAEFGAVIVMVGQFTGKYAMMIRFLQSMFGSTLSIQKGMEYFDLPVESRDKALESPTESITLDHVCYTYPEAGEPAVKDIALTLRSGETIAVIGKNGSGKTTLSKLVMGLIDPTEGTVAFNGVSTHEVEYASLYKDTTSVFQDHSRYYLRLRDNITIGAGGAEAPDAQLNQLLQSLHIGFADEETGVGLDTALGVEFGGIDLSGGQWQQLAIARGAFKQAQIVVLDEPTSALDPLKEAEMYDAFAQLCQGRIGMVITHRLGMCAIADRVLVMDQGRMAEYGTHEELMRQGGIYCQMYEAQHALYAADGE